MQGYMTMLFQYKKKIYTGLSGCEDVYKYGRKIGIIISSNGVHSYYHEMRIVASAASPVYLNKNITKVKKWIESNE